MQTEILAAPHARGPASDRRAIALDNVRLFRAMAWRALRDGGPKAELRAANAREAARIALTQARRASVVDRVIAEALAVGA